MKKISLIAALLWFQIGLAFNFTIPESKGSKISFTENKGQICDQDYRPRTDVLYTATDGKLTFHIKNNGISYQLYKIDTRKQDVIGSDNQQKMQLDQISVYRVDANWLNINPNFTKEVDNLLKGYNNYYLEQCPDGILDVKSYKDVTFKNIYNGINLHYYEREGVLKYDYIVDPKTDFKQIQIEIKGAEIKMQENGSLLFRTPLGDIEEGSPVAYQNGKKLAAKWKVENNILSFEVINYDPDSKLVIDPPTRIWGTYYGGNGDELTYSCEVISNGAFMCGSTSSATMIATSGAYQTIINGSSDAFISKFTATGTRIWSTYYGGNSTDIGYSCKTDATGQVYMLGRTSSSGTVLASVGAHQTSFAGQWDVFLAKFDLNGYRKWGTYYGGTSDERVDNPRACTIDSLGFIYFTGNTDSGTGISTSGSHQTTYALGYDAFLAKFDSSGVIRWATYYGGNTYDSGRSCSLDNFGNIYMVGYATSYTTNIISTSGSYQPLNGGGRDAFLVKFDTSGVRIWGTYYGGAAYLEEGLSCSTDIYGNVYFTGITDSNSVNIATLGAFQNKFANGFLAKFDSMGVRKWCTYYGGYGGGEKPTSIVTDIKGDIYLLGYTKLTTPLAIASSGAYQLNFNGYFDGYIAKFDSSGVRKWGTYLGGLGQDIIGDCAITPSGDMYVVGWSDYNTSGIITTAGAYQNLFGGGYWDSFLMKFNDCIPNNPGPISGNIAFCVGTSVQTYSVPLLSNANAYSWSLPIGWTGTSTTNVISVTPGLSSGTLSITATNTCGITPPTILNISVYPSPSLAATTSNTQICLGQTATLTVNGANSYLWNTTSTTSVITVSPSVTTTYTVTGTDINGCQNSTTITQSVSACTGLFKILNQSEVNITPNPNNGEFVISIYPLSKSLSVVIYNSLGQMIIQESLKDSEYKVSLKDQANGIYFVKVLENGHVVCVSKVIKE